MSSIVVTGASGFLGRAVVTELARRRVATVAVSRRSIAPPPGVKQVQLDDYCATPAPQDAVLLHLAEESRVSVVTSDVAAMMQEQVARLLAKPYRRVVYASSGIIYGDKCMRPLRPEDPPEGIGGYVASKLACEHQILNSGHVVVRLANVFGPGMTRHTVIDDILRQVPGNGPVRVADPTPVRDYVWIGDVATGLSDIVAGVADGVFNLGTGCGHSVGEIVGIACRLASQSKRGVLTTARQKNVSHLVLDVSRTSDTFGWRPQISLEVGLKKMMGL